MGAAVGESGSSQRLRSAAPQVAAQTSAPSASARALSRPLAAGEPITRVHEDQTAWNQGAPEAPPAKKHSPGDISPDASARAGAAPSHAGRGTSTNTGTKHIAGVPAQQTRRGAPTRACKQWASWHRRPEAGNSRSAPVDRQENLRQEQAHAPANAAADDAQAVPVIEEPGAGIRDCPGGWNTDEVEDALAHLGLDFGSAPRKSQLTQKERLRPIPSAVPDRLEAGSPEANRAQNRLDWLIKRLANCRRQERVPEAYLPDDQYVELARTFINPGDEFTPGAIHTHRGFWRQYFEAMAGGPNQPLPPTAKRVLQVLETGPQAQWLHPRAAQQQKHPHWQRRLDEVHRALTTNGYSPEEVEQLMDRDSPGRVHLANLRSAHEHSDFVTREVMKYLEGNRIQEWHWPGGEPPECILPLGVAIKATTGEERMVFDGRYVNLFDPYEYFSYEKLSDILAYSGQGSYASVSDFKAGYHHICCPELSTYLAFEWMGVAYCFTCVPFGLARGCRLFSEVVSAMWWPIREAGINLTSYIDDRLNAQRSLTLAKRDNLLLFAVTSALGWFISLNKTTILPVQEVQFLGLLVDYLNGRFVIPAGKLAVMDTQMAEILSMTDSPQARLALQSLAGRVMSVKPALHLAPLFCRNLFWAASGRITWEEAFGGFEGVREALEYLRVAVPKYNGTNFWKASSGMVFCGDAGDYGAGGSMLTGEITGPVLISYTPEQLEAVRTHHFHSTAREIFMVWVAVQVIMPLVGNRLRRRKLTYLTDSQAAYYCIMAMRATSSAEMQWIRDIWTWCADRDIDFKMAWAPRYTNELVYSDYLSKVFDNSAWAIRNASYLELLLQLGLAAEDIVLDPFADDLSTRARIFFSLGWCPGSSGIDGFIQSWRRWVPAGKLAFVNGPFHLMHDVLRKVAEERVDCVLITPAWKAAWTSLLQTLPIVKTHRLARRNLGGGRRAPIFEAGSRVDPAMRRGAEKWAVNAHLIRWSPEAAFVA